MSRAQTKRSPDEFFHFVDGVRMPLSYEDLPPLVPRTSTDSPSSPSSMSLVLMNEMSSCSLQIVAERVEDYDSPYLPAGYHQSNLLSPRLAALEVAGPHITLNLTP